MQRVICTATKRMTATCSALQDSVAAGQKVFYSHHEEWVFRTTRIVRPYAIYLARVTSEVSQCRPLHGDQPLAPSLGVHAHRACWTCCDRVEHTKKTIWGSDAAMMHGMVKYVRVRVVSLSKGRPLCSTLRMSRKGSVSMPDSLSLSLARERERTHRRQCPQRRSYVGDQLGPDRDEDSCHAQG